MCLNAPFGARCFLTPYEELLAQWNKAGLNAPFGARCFLTVKMWGNSTGEIFDCLNAPFGARCFLTHNHRGGDVTSGIEVLMHLLALGAF